MEKNYLVFCRSTTANDFKYTRWAQSKDLFHYEKNIVILPIFNNLSFNVKSGTK